MLLWAALNSILPWLMFAARHTALRLGFRAGMHLRCAYSGVLLRKVRVIEACG